MTQEEAAKQFILVYKNSKFVSLLSSSQKLKLLEKAENSPTVILLEAINYLKSRDKQFKDVQSPQVETAEKENIYELVHQIQVISTKLKLKYNIA
jgi:hypothetical protein